jgi:hypothetical protein
MRRSGIRGLLVTLLVIPAIAVGAYAIVDGRAASTETSAVQEAAAQESMPTCEASQDQPSRTMAAHDDQGLEETAPDDSLGPQAYGACRWDCWPCSSNADCVGHGSVCHPICP